MKKILIPALLIASLFAVSNASAKLDTNAAVRAAKAAGCLAFNESQVFVEFDTTSICINAGTVQLAHVYLPDIPLCVPRHHQPPCPRPSLRLVADVTFGCDGKVGEVICYVGRETTTPVGEPADPGSRLLENITTTSTSTAPVLNGFMIEQGAASTSSASVSLNTSILGGEPTEYLSSENPQFSGEVWAPWNPTPEFSLTAGGGSKTVYFKVRNVAGESTALQNSILFLPAIEITNFEIEGGRPVTKIQTIHLDYSLLGAADQYLASENPDFIGASWLPNTPSPKFLLSSSVGLKTIYLKVRSGDTESAAVSDTIRFNGK